MKEKFSEKHLYRSFANKFPFGVARTIGKDAIKARIWQKRKWPNANNFLLLTNERKPLSIVILRKGKFYLSTEVATPLILIPSRDIIIG